MGGEFAELWIRAEPAAAFYVAWARISLIVGLSFSLLAATTGGEGKRLSGAPLAGCL